MLTSSVAVGNVEVLTGRGVIPLSPLFGLLLLFDGEKQIQGMPLFTGRISNSQMIKDSEVLVEQRKFSEADSSSEKAFTNVVDKGFRNTLDAAIEGQTCM